MILLLARAWRTSELPSEAALFEMPSSAMLWLEMLEMPSSGMLWLEMLLRSRRGTCSLICSRRRSSLKC